MIAARPEVPITAIVGGRGTQSIVELVKGLPTAPNLALITVIHDEPALADVLRSASTLPVVEVTSSALLVANTIFVVPPNATAQLVDGQLAVEPRVRPGGPFDRLLRFAAGELGREAIGVVLGGSGSDGALGIKRLKESGGLALVEDVDDSSLAEMPHAAIATGLVDVVVPRVELGSRLAALAREVLDEPLEDEQKAETADALRDILSLVRIRSGHDFNAYKRATLFRRVARRVQVTRSVRLQDYHRYLRDHPAELSHLLRDFLISDTNFFRDPDVFAMLATDVVPKLFHDRSPTQPLRVWVGGCATGEEAYSLGILLLEYASRHGLRQPLQIFATDIDDDALTEARAGRYPETIEADVSRERLDRFFVKEGGEYRVTKELRELVLFSAHNVLRDPPFSRLDLIACRNLMIYLNREAQTRLLATFHFGLRPDGLLLLGASESAETSTLFSPLDAKYRVYRRVAASSAHETLIPTNRWWPVVAPVNVVPVESSGSPGEQHHRLVERYGPPSILVNGDLEIVHVSEHAGRYLVVSSGEPTRQLLKMIHPSLHLDLRTMIYAARQNPNRTDIRRLPFTDGGKPHTVEVRVRAIDMPDVGANTVLIYFDESDGAEEGTNRGETTTLLEPVVREMEDDLHRTRDQLRTTIEQYETSLEELKASNEELQAINEELRSASEELETSKEELQSVNEELNTLNHELELKVEEISRANSDLQNLMTSTDIGVLFLDRALKIKRFTPRALQQFNIIPSDVGRPLEHLTHHLAIPELSTLAKEVLQTLRTVERDVASDSGARFLVRILPYRSLEDRIEGVVITFVDVSDLRDAVDARDRSEAALHTSEQRLRASLTGAPVIVVSLDAESHVTWGYAHGKELRPGSVESTGLFAPSSAHRLAEIARAAIESASEQRTELEITIAGAARIYEVCVQPVGLEVTVIGFDITERKHAEEKLLDADRKKDAFLATLSHELRNPLTPLRVALDVVKLAENDHAQVQKSHAIMERQVTLLSELVDDLLDLSRITQGKIELYRVPLAPSQIVEAALETTRPLFQSARHDLDVRIPATGAQILGDLSRLSQVLTNLLANAAKYTPQGGHITLEVGVEQERGVVRFRVADDGVGIPADILPHVFEMFVQSRAALGRSRGGLGIGLNLVRRLVELHGGTVSAASAGQDCGSEFVVELPFVQA